MIVTRGGPNFLETIKLDTDATQHLELRSCSPDPPNTTLPPAQEDGAGGAFRSPHPPHTHSTTDS